VHQKINVPDTPCRQIPIKPLGRGARKTNTTKQGGLPCRFPFRKELRYLEKKRDREREIEAMSKEKK